jgi:uncharacterized membrane protein YhaH (DUF805 family)
MSNPSSNQDLAGAADLLHEAMPPRQLYLSLHGRISRRSFWLHGVLALMLLALVLMALLGIAGVARETAEQWVNALLLWPAVAISVKRWHDRGSSGWWVLVGLVPVIGWLWALVANGFLPGQVGPNRFGDAPTKAN